MKLHHDVQECSWIWSKKKKHLKNQKRKNTEKMAFYGCNWSGTCKVESYTSQ